MPATLNEDVGVCRVVVVVMVMMMMTSKSRAGGEGRGGGRGFVVQIWVRGCRDSALSATSSGSVRLER